MEDEELGWQSPQKGETSIRMTAKSSMKPVRSLLHTRWPWIRLGAQLCCHPRAWTWCCCCPDFFAYLFNFYPNLVSVWLAKPRRCTHALDAEEAERIDNFYFHLLSHTIQYSQVWNSLDIRRGSDAEQSPTHNHRGSFPTLIEIM